MYRAGSESDRFTNNVLVENNTPLMISATIVDSKLYQQSGGTVSVEFFFQVRERGAPLSVFKLGTWIRKLMHLVSKTVFNVINIPAGYHR